MLISLDAFILGCLSKFITYVSVTVMKVTLAFPILARFFGKEGENR